MNGCIIVLTNTGISIFDKTKKLNWFTTKEPTSRVWNLDLAIFQQTESASPVAMANYHAESPVAMMKYPAESPAAMMKYPA